MKYLLLLFATILFLTCSASADISDYAYSKEITLNQTMIDQSIGTERYVVFLSMTDTDLRDYALDSGHDIIFTYVGNSTQLDHVIEYFNGTTGQIIAHIGVDDVKNVSSVKMYYGYSGATDTQTYPDSTVVGHWPLSLNRYNISSKNTEDISSYGNNGTSANVGTFTDNWLSQSNQAMDFNGTSDYVSVGTSVGQQFVNEIFISGWSYVPSSAASTTGFMHFGAVGATPGFYIRILNAGDNPMFVLGNGVARDLQVFSIPTPRDVWFHVSFVTDGVTKKLFIDGDLKQTITLSIAGPFTTSTEAVIGWGYGVSELMDGNISSTIISNTAKSAPHISTTYNNSMYPSLFLSTGPQHNRTLIHIELTTPSPINTNYTGTVTQSYLVTHGNPLNLSSLAYLYGVNYTVTGDMHSYMSVPYNDISSEGIYRAPNRNKTPYLSWEFNTTITNNSVWQWSGGDNDSTWITKTIVDSTHTYINVTRTTNHIFPSSNYIARDQLYQAPKTEYDISKAQGIIIKIWDTEQFRGRNNDYFLNMFFDSDIKSTLPIEDIELYILPGTFDPLTGDPAAEGQLVDTWNSTVWMTHTFTPHSNASYTDKLTIAAGTITPAKTYYAYLKSNTPSSKAYTINATNSDPGITNITFAQTDSMWLRNEIAGTTAAVAYTPSFFTTFTRNFLEFDTQMYIADTNGTWGHSGVNTTVIGLSEVPVSAVSFEYFNKSCTVGGHVHDTGMDGTYDDGSIQVALNCPADPDGGYVDHNLTLHHANRTFIAVINDTFNTTGLESLEINFTTSTYYSLTNLYTLKCVSEDEENNVVTRWLDKNFTMAADGTQAWVDDTRILFWGMNDIPTLYAVINDSSLISYHAGTDIYTMHVPFFKSKANDSFYFNETVHLESLNTEYVAYFRMLGTTIFDYAYIYGWDTTLNSAAPATDTYRSYVYSCCESVGNITNSEMSYLGTNEYQQEGLNFISNTRDYLIYNSTFSHNAEGPIFEYSENMNISYCTITDNANVGLGIYYSNDSILSHNTITFNGGRGISIYEGNNHNAHNNTIVNSGAHGIHTWSNSLNNTYTANTITGSSLYDYYFTSSSTDNYIVDPASTTDHIRVASTSGVKIENTDNYAFTHDSLNVSHAYITNFSMIINSTSQTFDITQVNMTIVPVNNSLAIENMVFGKSVLFNANSTTALNPTWFNITNDRFDNKNITLFIDSSEYATIPADANGHITYNYTDNLVNKLFEFRFVVPPANMPLSIFMALGALLFIVCAASFYLVGIPAIFTSMLSIMIAFIMSQTAINGTLVQNVGGISSSGAIVQAVTIIQVPALAYILAFVGLFMVVILVIHVMREIKWRETKDIVEIDI